MTNFNQAQGMEDAYEYHVSTGVERVRKLNGPVAQRWLFFDMVRQAAEFFYDNCTCGETV